jgi:hypothetical protein
MPWADNDDLSPTNLNNKSGLVYSVREYGATGDGTTDDYGSIQSALDAAASFVSSSGTETRRPTVDLGGYSCSVSSALSWRGAGGLVLQHGSVVASASFPTNRYVLELGQDGGVNQATRLVTIRDVTVDAQRVAGVGCISLVNHGKVTLDNVYCKRFNSYGIRSQNGSGTNSNELSVQGCRFDEWPEDDGRPSAVSGTAISIEHNDSEVINCVIGSCRTGIALTGQYNLLGGNHIYCGYRESAVTLTEPASSGIHITTSHQNIINNYIDQCILSATSPSGIRVLGNLFYTSLSSATMPFIRFNLNSDAAMSDVVVAFNSFHNDSGTVISNITTLGGGAWTSGTSAMHFRNLIDYNQAPSGCTALRYPDIAVGTPAWVIDPMCVVDGTVANPSIEFASERSLGLYRSGTSTIATSYGTFRATGLLVTEGGNLALGNLTGRLRIQQASATTLTMLGEDNNFADLNVHSTIHTGQVSIASTTLGSVSLVSGRGYLYADSVSSLYWVNGSGVSTLVA